MTLEKRNKDTYFYSPNLQGGFYPEFDGLKRYISSNNKYKKIKNSKKPIIAFLKMKDLCNEETFVDLINRCGGESADGDRSKVGLYPIIIIAIENFIKEKESLEKISVKEFSINKRFYQNKILEGQSTWLWSESIWHQYVILNESFNDNLDKALSNISDNFEGKLYNFESFYAYANDRLSLWERQNWKLTPSLIGALKLSNGKKVGKILSGFKSGTLDEYSNLLVRESNCLMGRILALAIKALKQSIGNYINSERIITSLSEAISDKKISLYRASHAGGRAVNNEQFLFNAIREALLTAHSNFNWSKSIQSVIMIDDEIKSTSTSQSFRGVTEHLNEIFHFGESDIHLYGAAKFENIHNFMKEETVLTHTIEKWEKKGKSDFESVLPELGYFLIDLWDGWAMSGFETIKALRAYFADQAVIANDHVPVIIAMSQLDDPDTVRLAYESGADGFISKKDTSLGSICFSLIRSGVPFNAHDYLDYMNLVGSNFTCIQRLPRLMRQQLYWQRLDYHPGINNSEETNKSRCSSDEDLQWLRQLPKSDLHVHFGMAIHPFWCYILSIISLYKYCHQNEDLEMKLRRLFDFFRDIFFNVENDKKSEPIKITRRDEFRNIKISDNFREIVLSRIAQELNDSSIISLNSALAAISRKYGIDKAKDFSACAFNAYLCLIKHYDKIENWLSIAIDTLIAFKQEMFQGKSEDKKIKDENEKIHYAPINSNIYKDVRKIINAIVQSDQEPITTTLGNVNQWFFNHAIENKSNAILYKWAFDPLSSILAVGLPSDNHEASFGGFGLLRYIGAADLAGGTLLHFPETILLASIAIPRWCNPPALQDINKDALEESCLLPGTLEEFYTDNRNGFYRDNIVHLELRTTPLGFLSPFGEKDPKNAALATELILLGLEFGCRYPANKSSARKGIPKITANLLISIKRDRSSKEIESLIGLAVDFTKKFRNYTENRPIHGYLEYAPHVSGLDVAGIERGNLPEKLKEHFNEAFEYSLIPTIHAGETEDPKSIWQAIHFLGAKRLGHALSLAKDVNLTQFVRDTGLPLEICPRSNHFVHGYAINPKSEQDDRQRFAAYEYCENNISVNINTDDPILSHRIQSNKHFVYPLSEEFRWLAAGALEKSEKKIQCESVNCLTKLRALKLINCGFMAMFCSPQLKASRIASADREIYKKLIEEFIDFGILNSQTGNK